MQWHVLPRMSELLPVHAGALRTIAARLVDLLPVTRESYYNRDAGLLVNQECRHADDQRENGYALLDEVQGGDGAQLAFWSCAVVT